MGYHCKATDWMVSSGNSLSGANYYGGGIFSFDFYSETAGYAATVHFNGGGIGFGGVGVGKSIPFVDSWTAIQVNIPFSMADLDGAPGRLTSAGTGVLKRIGIGTGVLYITCSPRWLKWTGYFNSQDVGGPGFNTSTSLGAMSLIGKWRWVEMSNNKPDIGNLPKMDEEVTTSSFTTSHVVFGEP